MFSATSILTSSATLSKLQLHRAQPLAATVAMAQGSR